MMLAKRSKGASDSKRLSVNIVAWLVVACLVLAFPLAGCGNSTASSAKSSTSSSSSASKSASASSSSSSQPQGSPSSSAPAQSPSGVTPAVKAALDEYEGFMNDYCDFMRRYMESGYSASMLSDYSRFMNRYAEMTKKFNAIDKTTFTAADSAYYAEVAARTTKRLSELL